MQEESTTKVKAEHIWFIAENRLGFLEQATKQMTSSSTKRKRQVGFNNIAQVLKRLKLIPSDCKVIGLSFGCLDYGERGLFIIAVMPGMVVPDPTSTQGEQDAQVDQR